MPDLNRILSAKTPLTLAAVARGKGKNHEPLVADDIKDLKHFLNSAVKLIGNIHHTIAKGKFEDQQKEAAAFKELIEDLAKMRKNHLKRFKSGNISPGASMLYQHDWVTGIDRTGLTGNANDA